MKDGKPDLSKATHCGKNVETGKVIYFFANGARVEV